MNKIIFYLITITMIMVSFSFADYKDSKQWKSIFKQPSLDKLLPPIPEFKGDTSMLLKKNSSYYKKWATPTEKTQFRTTATYKQVRRYIKKITKASPYAKSYTIAKLPGGYRMNLVVISKKAKHLTAKGLKKTGLPTVFIEAGIHPAENGGIDASLILMRQLLITKKLDKLLDHANIIIIPILNITGHERQANHGFSRSNQRGPVNSGWRTNTQNYNLNRDFSKLDTKEIRAVMRVLHTYDVALWIDSHETDGMNYQYDVTWCNNGVSGYSPNTTRWLNSSFNPSMAKLLKSQGQQGGECIDANDPMNPMEGYYPYYSDGPRFSNPYGDAIHVPSLLLEIHSLDTNKQRIVGSYDFFVNAIKIISNSSNRLNRAIRLDKKSRPKNVVLDWTTGSADHIPVAFKGYDFEIVNTSVTDGKQIIWTDKKETLNVKSEPTTKPLYTAIRPKVYWIPAAWTNIIHILKLHGIKMKTLKKPKSVTLTYYKVPDGALKTTDTMYEGHTRVQVKKFIKIKRTRVFLPGSVMIKTNQDLGTLAVILLEPKAVDSFFRWGYFNNVMHNAEEMENYIMIPLAKKMLQVPGFKKSYATAIKNLKLDTPSKKANWIYKQTPFYDQNANVYPVGIQY